MAPDTRIFAPLEGSDIDTVSVTNGSLQVKIPLWSIKQRGNLALDFTLRYASSGFAKTEFCSPVPNTPCTYSYGVFGSGPFSEHFGVYVASSTDVTLLAIPAQWENTGGSSPTYYYTGYYWQVTTPDGGTHKLANIGNKTFRAEDGSGWFLNENTFVLTSSDGIHYVFTGSEPAGGSPPNSPPTAGRLLYVEDANGNQINLTYSSYVSAGVTYYAQTGWVDSIGRTIPYLASTATTDYSGCSGQGAIVGAATWTPPGETSPIKLCSANVQLNTDFFGGVAASQPGAHQTEFEDQETKTELQSVVLPDGSAWTFQYTPLTPVVSPQNGKVFNYGELTQLTLPTGGTLGYVWSENYQNCVNSSTKNHYDSSLSQRILNANDINGALTWTYSGGTTTDPLGNKTVHTLTGLSGTCSLFETETDYYDNHSNKLRTDTTTYFSQPDMNRISTNTTNESPTAMAVFPHVKTTTWANGATKSTTLTYDPGFSATSLDGSITATIPYGKVVNQVDTDYGSSSVGPTLKTTVTNYYAFQNSTALANNLLDPVSSVQVTDGPTGKQTITTYGYDEVGLVAGNATTGWNSNPLSGSVRGNQTGIYRYWDTKGVYLHTANIFTNTGLISSVTEPSNPTITPAAVKSYQYSSTYDGAYLTAVVDALGNTKKYGYDEPTGLLTSTTDQNSVQTIYGYDEMQRLQSSSRPGGSHNLASSIGYTYPNPNTVTRTVVLNSSIPAETDTTTYDGLGRANETQHVDPEGTVYVDTTYDGLGRKSTVSTPYRSKSDATAYGLTTYSYDAIGRTTQVQNPVDNTVSTFQYAGATTLATSASNGTTTPQKLTRVDGLGRLTTVCEITSATPPVGTDAPASCGLEITGTGFLTSYTQTIRGLTAVTQGAQSRSFAYDSLGQLTSSTNPETGATTFVYDNDGNVSSKTSNAADSNVSSPISLTTNYQYDALHRLTGKSYSSSAAVGASTPSVTYNYGQASVAGATLENYVGHLTSEYTTLNGSVQTQSIYSYDNAGSVESHYQCVSGSCGANQYQDVEYHYDGAENLTSKATAQNSFTYSYDQANHLTSLTPGWTASTNFPSMLIASATYVPNGGWNLLSLGNLSNESYTYTPRWLQGMQVNGYNPNSLPHGSGALQINGAEESKQVQTAPATAGSGSVTLSGAEKSKIIYPPGCPSVATVSPDVTPPCRSSILYDIGTLTIAVNGHSDSVSWGQGSTTSTLASALAAAINGDSSASASASASGAVVFLLSKTTGVGANYTLSVSSADPNTGTYANSFSIAGGPALTGGAAPVYSTTYDSGTLTVTVGSTPLSIGYGSTSTNVTLTNSLVAAINANASYPVTASTYGSQTNPSISLVAKEGGTVGNYSLAFGTAYNSSQFSAASYTPVTSGSSLTGGQNQTGTETAIYNYTVGHAPNGQIQSSSDSVNGNWRYVYDSFNRLQSATETNGGGATVSALAWDYDRYGNRWHQNLTGGSGTTQLTSYNTATNQATTNLGYDAAGDVLSDGVHNYQYDAEGRIAQVDGATSYIYDAEGRRVGKSGGTVYVVGLNGDVIDALNGGAWQRTEVYAGGRHLATVTPSGVVFTHSDWIGTERARTNPLGELCQFNTSQPFGDGVQTATPSGGVPACSPTPDFLTGKPRDSESNLDDFGARYFSSSYGRWMSPDWSSTPQAVPYASLTNPQSLNLYAYVGNDPIDRVDRDGHFVLTNADGYSDSYSGLDAWETLQESNQDAAHPSSQKKQDLPQTTDSITVTAKTHWWNRLGSWFAGNGAAASMAFGRFGRLGGPAHRAAVGRISRMLNDDGFDVTQEKWVPTPNGSKSGRFIDVYGQKNTPDGVIVRAYQIGRTNQNGTPVAREVQALDDIEEATFGLRPSFISYNNPAASGQLTGVTAVTDVPPSTPTAAPEEVVDIP